MPLFLYTMHGELVIHRQRFRNYSENGAINTFKDMG